MQTLKHLFAQHLNWTSLGVHSIFTISDDSGGASHDGVFKVSVPMHTTPQRDRLVSTPPVMMGVLKISVSTQHLDGTSLEFYSIFTLSDDSGGASHG